MKVVIVEDDPNKGRQLRDFLLMEWPTFKVALKASYASGLREIRVARPDMVLLDMSLPNFDGAGARDVIPFRSFGGRDILGQLRRRGLRIPVIVVTQYERFPEQSNVVTLESLSEHLAREFADNYVGTVYYNASQDDWKMTLRELIQTIGGR